MNLKYLILYEKDKEEYSHYDWIFFKMLKTGKMKWYIVYRHLHKLKTMKKSTRMANDIQDINYL